MEPTAGSRVSVKMVEHVIRPLGTVHALVAGPDWPASWVSTPWI